MKWTLVLATLFLVGCPTAQEVADQQMMRKEHRECLLDRVKLIDKVEVMKIPPVPECPVEVKGVLTPELDKASARDKCLYVIDRFGAGTFDEKEQAFRTCWDREDNSRTDKLWECRQENDDLEDKLRLCQNK